MSDKMQTAIKGVKEMQTEMVQWEMRLDGLKAQIESMTRQKDLLQAEIDRKVADAQILLSTRDNESRRKGLEAEAGLETLSKQRAEFAEVLAAFKREQSDFLNQKQDVENMKAGLAQDRNKINTFIVAAEKAYSVLG